jgi:hypothetical protein
MTSERIDPPTIADEETSLVAWLDFHRDTLLLKAHGLDQEQLARRLEPSTLTLGGLVKHMALVESSWLSARLRGEPMIAPFEDAPWDDDPDWEFHSAKDDTPEELVALFAASRAASDEIIAATLADGGLDTISVGSRRDTGEHFDLRWILTHLVEEYARHNGHADLIRESIDGQTGD